MAVEEEAVATAGQEQGVVSQVSVSSIERKIADLATNGEPLQQAARTLSAIEDPAQRDVYYEKLASGKIPGLDGEERALLRSFWILDKAFRKPVDKPEEIIKAIKTQDISDPEAPGTLTIEDVLKDAAPLAADPGFIRGLGQYFERMPLEKARLFQEILSKVATRDNAVALATIWAGLNPYVAGALLAYTFRKAPVTTAKLAISSWRGDKAAQAEHINALMSMSNKGASRAGALLLLPFTAAVSGAAFVVRVLFPHLGVKFVKSMVSVLADEKAMADLRQKFHVAASDPVEALKAVRQIGGFVKDIPHILVLAGASALNKEYANYATKAIEELAKRDVFKFAWERGFDWARGLVVAADSSEEMTKLAEAVRQEEAGRRRKQSGLRAVEIVQAPSLGDFSMERDAIARARALEDAGRLEPGRARAAHSRASGADMHPAVLEAMQGPLPSGQHLG